MLIPFLISKIHNARVTGVNLEYSGSITIDTDLMEKAKMRQFQQVDIYNITNGKRFTTYVINGQKGSGQMELNGAAARLAAVGDKIIVAAYAHLDERELDSLCSVILIMNEKNEVEKVINGKL